MTKKASSSARSNKSAKWPLQEAEARFGEVVRRARSDGPQRVIVDGREEAVVISSEEFQRLSGEPDGRLLVAAMKDSPHRDLDIEPQREAMPVRDVVL